MQPVTPLTLLKGRPTIGPVALSQNGPLVGVSEATPRQNGPLVGVSALHVRVLRAAQRGASNNAAPAVSTPVPTKAAG